MKNIWEKVKNNISIVIIVGIIILSGLLIGTPIKEKNARIIYIISGIFSAIYYITKREKVIEEKIDILVVTLFGSALIPLIFKTYTTLSGTLILITKSICILNMFLITKHECKKNPKYRDVILNAIIITILILCIFGLDEIGNNYLKNIKKLIGYRNIGLKESRIGSLFSYANAMATVAATGVFLCLGYVFSNKKIFIKILYICMSIVMFVTMILTYSRFVYLVFALMCMLYILILCKKYKIIKRVNKKLIITIGISCLVIILYVIIGLNISEKLEIEKSYQKKFFDIKPQTEYKFSFDINAKSKIKNNFVIQIVEKNQYLDTLKKTEIKFDDFEGKKEINIKTKKDTTTIYLNFKRKKQKGEFVVNEMALNDKNIILKYKLLPTKTIFKIQSIDLKQKSAWQRIVYIEDAFKSIKDNWLFGYGGNSWNTLQTKQQEFSYYAKEVHSYPVQMFLENGIIAVIAITGIGIYLLKIGYDEIKSYDIDIIRISSIIAILNTLIHSIFDFDMSFFYIALIIFIILSTISKQKQGKSTQKIIQKIPVILLIIITITITYIPIMQIEYENYRGKIKRKFDLTEIEIDEIYYKLMPFDVNAKFRLYNALQPDNNINNSRKKEVLENILYTEKHHAMNVNLKNIKSYIEICINSNIEDEEYLEVMLEYIRDTEQLNKYRPKGQLERLNNFEKIVTVLNEENKQEYANKFKEQLQKEIEEKEERILDYNKGRYSKKNVSKYRDALLKIKQQVYK